MSPHHSSKNRRARANASSRRLSGSGPGSAFSAAAASAATSVTPRFALAPFSEWAWSSQGAPAANATRISSR